jgi:hypothetical protein
MPTIESTAEDAQRINRRRRYRARTVWQKGSDAAVGLDEKLIERAKYPVA